MHEPNQYMSKLLTDEIFPSFFVLFKTEESKNSYMTAFKEFTEYLKKDILSITPDDCARYQNFLLSKNAAQLMKYNTIIKKRKQLSSLFAFIEKHSETFQIIGFRNYYDDLKLQLPPETFHIQKVPTIGEYDSLFGYLKKNDLMCLCAVLLSFKVFLKHEQFRLLSTNDFFESDGKMVVRVKDSTGDIRYNYIPSDVAVYINSYIEILTVSNDSEEIYLFANKNGKPYIQKTFRNRLLKAELACNIPGYTFNDFRNSGVVFAISNNADVNAVADSLGYKQKNHIKKLETLKIKVNDVADYININIK